MIPKIQKILYATDLSPNAVYTLRYAMNSAIKHDAEVIILHVLEIQAEILEEKQKTIGMTSTYRLRIRSRIQASDFIKAESEDTKQEKEETKESYREEMEQPVSAEIDPGRDIAKAYRLIREKKWRLAGIYLNHLGKNTRTGAMSIWPEPLSIIFYTSPCL